MINLNAAEHKALAWLLNHKALEELDAPEMYLKSRDGRSLTIMTYSDDKEDTLPWIEALLHLAEMNSHELAFPMEKMTQALARRTAMESVCAMLTHAYDLLK